MAKKPPLKITKRNVTAAPVPEGRDEYYWDPELKGFGLRVTPRGVKSYVVQYRLRGRPARRLTLGIHGSPWTADRARTEAQTLLIEVKKGNDPIETKRKRERDARDLEFSAYVDRFVEGYLKEAWADSWQDAERRLKTHVVPRLKGRALPDIRPDEITPIFDVLKDRRALARNTYAVLRLLFKWAADPGRGDIERSPMAGMKAPPKPKDRKRVLSPDELIALWRASLELEAPFGPFIRMLMLTLQRRSEVAGLLWKELDHNMSIWRIDAERAKNDEDHLTPLSELALRELTNLGWKRKGLVFTTTGSTPISGFSKLKKRLDEKMLPILQQLADERAEALGEEPESVQMEPWRLHDIRRTGSTQMQALGIPVEVTEACLNHIAGEAREGIRGVYNLWKYEPEKRRAFTAWGGYLEQLVTAKSGSNVVALAEMRA